MSSAAVYPVSPRSLPINITSHTNHNHNVHNINNMNINQQQQNSPLKLPLAITSRNSNNNNNSNHYNNNHSCSTTSSSYSNSHYNNNNNNNHNASKKYSINNLSSSYSNNHNINNNASNHILYERMNIEEGCFSFHWKYNESNSRVINSINKSFNSSNININFSSPSPKQHSFSPKNNFHNGATNSNYYTEWNLIKTRRSGSNHNNNNSNNNDSFPSTTIHFLSESMVNYNFVFELSQSVSDSTKLNKINQNNNAIIGSISELEMLRKSLVLNIYKQLNSIDLLREENNRWLNFIEFCRDTLNILPLHYVPNQYYENQDNNNNSVSSQLDNNVKQSILRMINVALYFLTCRNLNIPVNYHHIYSKNNITHNNNFNSDTIMNCMNTCSTFILSRYSDFTAPRLSLLSYFLKHYRSLTPYRILMNLINSDNCTINFDYFGMNYQDYLVKYIMYDAITMQFPPSIQYEIEFWGSFQRNIELFNIEVNEAILNRNLNLIQLQSKQNQESMNILYNRNNNNSIVDPANSGYATLTYKMPSSIINNNVTNNNNNNNNGDNNNNNNNNNLNTITLRVERGFSSTTGLALWPAGFFMSEFLLSNSAIFTNKTILELGSGLGLPSLLASRIGAKFIIATDCDERAINNLSHNAIINGISVIHPFIIDANTNNNGNMSTENNNNNSNSQSNNGIITTVDNATITNSASNTPITTLSLSLDCSSNSSSTGLLSTKLDWSSYNISDLISFNPDIIISCDTIYLPEFHENLANIVRESLENSQNPNTACCYFSQVLRNIESFNHYIHTFQANGLQIEELDIHKIEKLFDYSRENVKLQRITLKSNKTLTVEISTNNSVSTTSSISNATSSNSNSNSNNSNNKGKHSLVASISLDSLASTDSTYSFDSNVTTPLINCEDDISMNNNSNNNNNNTNTSINNNNTSNKLNWAIANSAVTNNNTRISNTHYASVSTSNSNDNTSNISHHQRFRSRSSYPMIDIDSANNNNHNNAEFDEKMQ